MDKTKIVIEKLGHMGRLLSGSKSTYSTNHPGSRVFFNGNIYDAKGEKIWFGDVDLTREAKKLQEIVQALGEKIYVTREQPFRWEEQTTKTLQAACQGEYPNAYVIQPGE